MNDTDKNLYLQSLEEENEKLRSDLRNLKNDSRELAFEKFQVERELNRSKSNFSIKKACKKIEVKTFNTSVIPSSFGYNGSIRMDMVLESNIDNGDIQELLDDFKIHIKTYGYLGVSSDKIHLL